MLITIKNEKQIKVMGCSSFFLMLPKCDLITSQINKNLLFTILVLFIYNLLDRSMKHLIACLVFLSFLITIYAFAGCTTTSDCTNIITSSSVYCNSKNICQCQDNFIFNCNNQANILSAGYNLLYLLPNKTMYYIISNYTDQTLEYILTLTDKTQIDMFVNYSIYLYVDNGFNSSPNVPTTTTADSGSQLKISLELKLGTMPSTNIAQYLIMAVQNKQSIAAFVECNLNFSSVGNSNIFLIVAYTGGGFCLCITIVLMVVVYRKNRNQSNPNERQNNGPTVNDISHFEALMPRSIVSIHQKKDGRVCSVCLQEFQLSSIVRTTVCNHIFHMSCIDEWCTKNLICPMCRTDLSSSNILLLKSKNNKDDNNSSWIVNTMDQEALNENQESEPNQAAVQHPSNSEGLGQPLLSSQNPNNHDGLNEPQLVGENSSNVERLDEPLVQAEDSNRASLIGNDQL